MSKKIKLDKRPQLVAEADLNNYTPENFFNDFIKKRSPIKLVDSRQLLNINWDNFNYDKLNEFLNYKLQLKVETKVNNGFGNGNQRVKMKLSELMEHFNNSNENYYLTTQYESDDESYSDSEGENTGVISEENLEVAMGSALTRSEKEEREKVDNHEKEPSSEVLDDQSHEVLYQRTQADRQDQDFKCKVVKLDDHHDGQEQLFDQHRTDLKTNNSAGKPSVSVLDSSDDEIDAAEIDLSNFQDDYQESDISDGDGFGAQTYSDLDSDDETGSFDEVNFRIKELFQPPLSNLFDKLPAQPPYFQNLIPQQINLWMGYNKAKFDKLQDVDLNNIGKIIPGNGTSSGLHHDHSDNLYILLSGIKRFTIVSPKYAASLYTVGNIQKVYANGVIDYKIDDCAPDWQHINEDGSIKKEGDFHVVSEGSKLIKHLDKNSSLSTLDPPNFSKVPPILLHLDEIDDPNLASKLIDYSEKNFPGFLELEKRQVWLKPGEMLYLPAGWFHEVTSFPNEVINDNSDNIHMALNYWFAPPDGKNFANPYKSNYWQDDFCRTTRLMDEIKSEKSLS